MNLYRLVVEFESDDPPTDKQVETMREDLMDNPGPMGRVVSVLFEELSAEQSSTDAEDK